jgi:hypothetical protein
MVLVFPKNIYIAYLNVFTAPTSPGAEKLAVVAWAYLSANILLRRTDKAFMYAVKLMWEVRLGLHCRAGRISFINRKRGVNNSSFVSLHKVRITVC